MASLRQNNYVLGIFSSIDGFEQLPLDELKKHHYTIDEVYNDDMCVFVSTHSRLLDLPTVTTKDVIAQYDTVNQIMDLISLNHYRNHPVLGKLMINSAYNFSDRENIKKFIAADLAVAVLPRSFARHDLYVEHGLITPLTLEDLDLSITGYLAYQATNITPQLQALIQCIKTYYAQQKNGSAVDWVVLLKG